MRLIDRGRDILPKDCNSDREKKQRVGSAMRFAALAASLVGSAVFAVLIPYNVLFIALFAVCAILSAIGIWDLLQTKHSIRRNYPILAHIRFMLEKIRPEIRQYFLESETDGTPFNRSKRAVAYQRAKGALDKRPFGTQQDIYSTNFEWIIHSIVPCPVEGYDFRVTVGGTDCRKPYALSLFNVSAMSFGSLSANAIMALNRGAKLGNFAHDTGEGSISQYHRVHGGDLVWEIGSGYFGCRDDKGRFSEGRFVANATDPQVKMVEIKLSQGAKPGHGGVLPGPKVTLEIAAARGGVPWVDCISPATHAAFSTPVEMMRFVERLRTLSGGKPTGFKLCIGHPWEWFGIAKGVPETRLPPDFIVVDGAEGGTGAAPLEFTDHVGAPLQEGLLLVHNTLVGLDLREHIRLGASGKVISAFDMARILAMGADWCNAARGFMFAVGGVQSRSCHTDRCPTGVATQDPRRQRALVVEDKSQRVFHFHQNTLHALGELTGAAGLTHPNELRPRHIVRRVSNDEIRLMSDLYKF